MSAKRSEDTSSVTVIYGKDRRRLTDALEGLLERLLEGEDPQMCLSQYEGEGAEFATVWDEVNTPSFFGGRRIVVVKDADRFIQTYRKLLEKAVAEGSRAGVLVMTAEQFPGTTNLAKLVKKKGTVVACEALKGGALLSYLREEAKQRYGMRLTSGAAEMLTEYLGEETGALLNELDKLASYLGATGEKAVTVAAADVEALAGRRLTHNVFEAIGAMMEGRTGRALELLEELMTQSAEAEYTAVGAFAWQVRRLYEGRAMLEAGRSRGEIIKQVRAFRDQDRFWRRVQEMPLRRCGEMLKRLKEIDLAAKTGAGTVRTGLEKLIIEMSRGTVMMT